MEKTYDKAQLDRICLTLQKSSVTDCIIYIGISQNLELQKSPSSCKSGMQSGEMVPQGGILSLTLFFVFISDMVKIYYAKSSAPYTPAFSFRGARRNISQLQTTDWMAR